MTIKERGEHPEGYDDLLPKKVSVWTEERLLKFVIFAIVMLFIGLTITFVQQADLHMRQDEIITVQQKIVDDRAVGRQNGFKNRAQSCRVQNALALELTEECLSPEVIQYYDHDEVISGTTFRDDTRVLLCELLIQQGLEVPSVCIGAGG